MDRRANNTLPGSGCMDAPHGTRLNSKADADDVMARVHERNGINIEGGEKRGRHHVHTQIHTHTRELGAMQCSGEVVKMRRCARPWILLTVSPRLASCGRGRRRTERVHTVYQMRAQILACTTTLRHNQPPRRWCTRKLINSIRMCA